MGLRLEAGKRLGASIAEAAAQSSPNLVVLGSHDRMGVACVLLGSGAEQIVRESSVPVLVVRAYKGQVAFQGVLVAIDGSDTSRRALVTALQLARNSSGRSACSIRSANWLTSAWSSARVLEWNR